jgi:hypothetical protein
LAVYSSCPTVDEPAAYRLSGLTKPTSAPYFGSFLKGMHDLNYAEGRNFEMIYRFSDGYADRLPVIGEEIVELKPNVIIATAVDSVVTISVHVDDSNRVRCAS